MTTLAKTSAAIVLGCWLVGWACNKPAEGAGVGAVLVILYVLAVGEKL